MATRYGTAHFVGVMAAINYYLSQGMGRTEHEAAMLVDQKVSAGEIFIGKPRVPIGAKLVLIDEYRYGFEDDND